MTPIATAMEGTGMARENVFVQWEPAKDYRLVQPDAVTVVAATMGQKPVAFLHFTTDMIQVRGENVPMEVSAGGDLRQVGKGESTKGSRRCSK
jgi:hypothetical protein